MINVKAFYDLLIKNNISFFAGVPDSLLKDFCFYIADNAASGNHIIAANEGGAVALTAGHYLATGKLPLVYMQNSGQGNSINPLVSLADSEVYGIPILLLIGWRGQPGVKDEPQHIKQGKITSDIMETLGIPYEILPDSFAGAKKAVKKAVDFMIEKNAPYAIIVKENTFTPYISPKQKSKSKYCLSREEAIKIVADQLPENDIIVSTTGKLSRELFEYRKTNRQTHQRDFLTVGSMGHSSQIALGIALAKKNRNIFCFDGDGALIMHMGSLAIIGSQAPKNFKHIVFNNEAHDSVGGQSTAAASISIPLIARACGYKKVFQARTANEVKAKTILLKSLVGPALLEIKLKKGARKDLGRPTTTPQENKISFMNFLSDKLPSL